MSCPQGCAVMFCASEAHDVPVPCDQEVMSVLGHIWLLHTLSQLQRRLLASHEARTTRTKVPFSERMSLHLVPASGEDGSFPEAGTGCSKATSAPLGTSIGQVYMRSGKVRQSLTRL